MIRWVGKIPFKKFVNGSTDELTKLYYFDNSPRARAGRTRKSPINKFLNVIKQVDTSYGE